MNSNFYFVMLGAFFGAPLRYLVDQFVQRHFTRNHPKRIPLGTLTVNVIGSATLGVAYVLLDGPLYDVVGPGFCGAFTTFATFIALTDESAREGWHKVAITNLVASVVLCIGIFAIFYKLAEI